MSAGNDDYWAWRYGIWWGCNFHDCNWLYNGDTRCDDLVEMALGALG